MVTETVLPGLKKVRKLLRLVRLSLEKKDGEHTPGGVGVFVGSQERYYCLSSCTRIRSLSAGKSYFYGCSAYPTCEFTTTQEELDFSKEDYAPDFDWDQPCPKCGKAMKLRHGRYGPFLGCTTYPDCRGIVNIPKKGEEIPQEKDLPKCPAVGCDGSLTPKRSRFGKIFFSCSTFPDCDVIVNTLDEVETKYHNHPKTAYVKKTKAKKTTGKGKTAKKGTKTAAKKKRAAPKQPEHSLSSDLQKVVGEKKLSRPQIIKKIWDYIKANDLQDPKNKRVIHPDATLAKILGKEAIDMFQLTKVVSAYVKEKCQ